MNAVLKPRAENPHLAALREYQGIVKAASLEFGKLDDRRKELEPVANQPEPDLGAIRTRITDALAEGAQAKVNELRSELDAAKERAGLVQEARRELAELRPRIEQAQSRGRDMAEQLKRFQHEALKERAEQAADEFAAKLDEAMTAWRLSVAIAEQAERFGGFLIPAAFRGGMLLEFPEPMVGRTATSRRVVRIAANDAEHINARTKAATIAQDILGCT